MMSPDLRTLVAMLADPNTTSEQLERQHEEASWSPDRPEKWAVLHAHRFRTWTDERGLRCGEVYVDGKRYAVAVDDDDVEAADAGLASAAWYSLRELTR